MRKILKTGQMAVAAGLLCSAFALSSCLLPQNDDPLPEIPPQKNRPPRLLRGQLDPKPPDLITFGIAAGCPAPNVKAVVEDPDTEDVIRVRWTVYNADGTRPTNQVTDTPNLPAGMLNRVVEAPSALFKPGSPLYA